jgi:hypothetical protein
MPLHTHLNLTQSNAFFEVSRFEWDVTIFRKGKLLHNDNQICYRDDITERLLIAIRELLEIVFKLHWLQVLQSWIIHLE